MSDFRMRVPTAEIEAKVVGGGASTTLYTGDPPALSTDIIGIWTTIVETAGVGATITVDVSDIFSNVISINVSETTADPDIPFQDGESVKAFPVVLPLIVAIYNSVPQTVTINTFDETATAEIARVSVAVHGVLL